MPWPRLPAPFGGSAVSVVGEGADAGGGSLLGALCVVDIVNVLVGGLASLYL